MKILFVKHASFEKPGCIATWASKRGYLSQEVSPYNGEVLPNVNDFDFLIVILKILRWKMCYFTFSIA